MALSAAYTGSAVTISGTAISLTAGTTSIQAQTSPGVYGITVDVNGMASGDQYEFYLYEKAVSAGTQRTLSLGVLTGAQAWPLFITGAFMLGNGWDFGVKKIAGADVAMSWTVWKEP